MVDDDERHSVPLPSRIPYFRDVPIENFPAEAWEVTGPTAQRRWRLRLRPAYLPPSLEAMVALDPDGLLMLETEITTAELAQWEHRWRAAAGQDAASLRDLLAAREARAEAVREADELRRRLTPEVHTDRPSIDDVKRAIAHLQEFGPVSDWTEQPTKEMVAAHLHTTEATIKRVAADARFAWPRRSDPPLSRT